MFDRSFIRLLVQLFMYNLCLFCAHLVLSCCPSTACRFLFTCCSFSAHSASVAIRPGLLCSWLRSLAVSLFLQNPFPCCSFLRLAPKCSVATAGDIRVSEDFLNFQVRHPKRMPFEIGKPKMCKQSKGALSVLVTCPNNVDLTGFACSVLVNWSREQGSFEVWLEAG